MQKNAKKVPAEHLKEFEAWFNDMFEDEVLYSMFPSVAKMAAKAEPETFYSVYKEFFLTMKEDDLV